MKMKNLLWQSILPSVLCCTFLQASSPARPNLASVNTISEANYSSDLASDGFYTWSPNKFPLKVHFAKNVNIPGFKLANVDLLKNCFDEWSRASDGRISWVETQNANDADIDVVWSNRAVEASRGTEAGNTRNYARYNPETNWGEIDHSKMRLLTRLPEREFTSVETKKAYLHEVGHALGIAGHSADPDDIMYFSVSNHKRINLSFKDIGTLHFLYENKNSNSDSISNASIYTDRASSVHRP